MVDDDIIELLDDDDAPAEAEVNPWTVVVVDDDAEVHAATTLALRRVDILGRPLQLLHYHSAAEAREQFALLGEPAVVLLDVVMETEDAGLQLVDFLRRQCRMTEVRIILRTGQPGQAPELEVFNRYDINDYRTKSELTRTRLITAISGAIRSYDQIRTIAENRRGLELIVRSAPDLLEENALNQFAQGVLTQVAALLRVPVDGIVCAQRGSPLDGDDSRLVIVGAAGRLAHMVMQPLDALEDHAIAALIRSVIEHRQHSIEAQHTALYLRAGGRDAAVFIAGGHDLSSVDQQLIQVFAANISACYSNLRRFEEINYIAFHDVLSGLGNRAQMLRDLQELAAQAATDTTLALLDICRFAELNDGLGQEVGNQVLAAVGRRLREQLGDDCRLARIAADVFAVAGSATRVNPGVLLGLFEQPFAVAGQKLPLRIILGLSRLQPGLAAASSALDHASIALNRAKLSSADVFMYFEPAMERSTRERLSIVQQLHSDFAQDRLQVWFQPQIGLADGAVIGIEALLRWPGERGFVQPPNVFVPLAEQSGLIIDMGHFVLERSLAALRQLRGSAHAPARVAVNVSVAQFRQHDFLTIIERAIAASGLPTQSIELEITESIAMDEPRAVGNALQALRELGVRIAVDDFGTGFSSLSQLRHLPIDALKIDQSFVREIDDGQGGAVVDTIITLANRIGVETVAEGVESEAQLQFLRARGCQTVQGYYFAKPMPLPTLVQWLQGYRSAVGSNH